jgi:LCP family protein required for cell wall assembly
MMEPRKHSSTKPEDEKGKKNRASFWLVIGIIIVGFLALAASFLFRPVPARINWLILGAGGEDHTAGDLTDTIIFLSFNSQTGQTQLLSLPRDIWVPAWRTKINSVYHYKGLEETKKVAGEILGQPIDYGLFLNFAVLTEAIDALGGVEVEVAHSFDDYRYPIAGKENDLCGGDPEFKCRYEHVHFDAGRQLMDGATALKYVRSRFAEGEEGTDFARSERQQRLLAAIQRRILSPQFFLRPQRFRQLAEAVGANLVTDFPPEKYGELIRLALRFRSQKVTMAVLGEDFLVNPPRSQAKHDGQWVLVPKTGNWEAVQEYVENLLTSNP